MLKKIYQFKIRLAAIAFVLLFAFSLVNHQAIAQLWMDLPILNGASYCASTVNSSCVATVPAGPSMTGLETFPLDTNANSGAGNPQTIKTNVTTVGIGKTVVSTNLTGDTVTVDAQTRQLILTPAGTLSTLTINLPAATAVLTGNKIGVCGTQIVTTLTMGAGTGNTFSTTAPTAMLVPVVTGAASCFEFLMVKTSATVGVWHRIQ